MNLIFDFDGTICNSLDVFINIINNYLPDSNKSKASAEEVRRIGVKEKIKSSNIPKLRIPKFIMQGRRQFSKIVLSLDTFTDIPEAIKTLSKTHTLGILTSNSRSIVCKFLSKHNLTKYFSFIYSEMDLFGKQNKLQKIIKNICLIQTKPTISETKLGIWNPPKRPE